MIDRDLIYSTLTNLYDYENVLDQLIEFEDVLDRLDIYVYKNWLIGEIVDGPHIDPYWITLSLMYPYNSMPDPEGAMRLIKHGCKVWYSKDTFISANKISSGSEDKTKRTKVWVVKIAMPKHFIDQEIADVLEVNPDDINTSELDEIRDAYDNNMTGEDIVYEE